MLAIKNLLAYTLVISLGLVLTFSFFKPWLPSWLQGACLTAYEPRLSLRIFEGCVGIAILCFGCERLISLYGQILRGGKRG
jgi:hypothetical protein